MKRYVEIGESFILLIKDYSEKRKKEIKKGLENYVFKGRKQDDVKPHPNSIKARRRLEAPNNYVEAILKYNCNNKL